MPAPPSVVALPPRHITRVSGLCFMAALMSSPVPRLVAFMASLRLAGTWCNPLPSATSTTAVRPSATRPYCAVTGSPSGPVTSAECSVPFCDSTRATVVPSPPSASGTCTTSSVGAPRLQPRAIAAATSLAGRHSLNESGAMRIRILQCYQ